MDKIIIYYLDLFIIWIYLGGTLSWLFYELIQNRHVEKKLIEEIDSVIGTRAIEFEDIKEMTYLKAVIDETLRLHPAVPVKIPNNCFN